MAYVLRKLYEGYDYYFNEVKGIVKMKKLSSKLKFEIMQIYSRSTHGTLLFNVDTTNWNNADTYWLHNIDKKGSQIYGET